ncbi:MAG: cytochrome c biogenesis protein CcdA [Phycisphaerae bacterium]|nr:cytochrome c biogenesis protein CcdA [Phycisphaerae bacterium]
MIRSLAIVAFVLAAALPALGDATTQPAVRQTRNIRIELLASQDAVRPGDSLQLLVRFSLLKPELHAYGHDMPDPPLGTPTAVSPGGPAGFTFAKPIYPASAPFELAGMKLTKYSGDFVVAVPVAAPATISQSSVTFTAKIDYQACTDEICLESSKVDDAPLSLTLPVRPAGAAVATTATEATAAPGPAPAEAPLAGWAGGSWALSLLAAMLIGLALNLTPCVLPIIPLTVGFFVYQAQQDGGGRSRRRAIVLAGLLFTAGMLATFLVLGGLVVLARGQLQVVFQYPGAVFGLGLFIVAMALGMFGVYPVQLPGFLANLGGGRAGLGGAFVMGALAAIMSTPCTGPLLGSMIGWALRAPPALGLAAFVGVGLGMAIPYLVLTIAPGLLENVPRSGRWTELVRTALGFILLGVAVQMFAGLRSQPGRWQFAIWASIALSAGVWAAAHVVRSNRDAGWVWPVRLVLLAGVVAGIAWQWPAEQAAVVEAGSGPIAGQTHVVGSTVWYDYDPALLDRARSAGLPVMLDLITDNCTYCEIMARKVWPTATAARSLEGIIAVRANMSRSDARDLGERYGVAGPPGLVFIDGGGKVVKVFSPVPFYADPEGFAKAVGPVRKEMGMH